MTEPMVDPILTVPSEEAMQHSLDALNVSGEHPELACVDKSGRPFLASLTDPDADHVHITVNGSSGYVECCNCMHPETPCTEWCESRWRPTYPVRAIVTDWPNAERVALEDFIDAWWLLGECASCGEGSPEGECPKSKRPCGHHCNHVWTHDTCDWCSVQVEYVVGFALDTRGRIALIRKNRPEWQAGHLNGIGGHVEPGEDPDQAMAREFYEETGTQLDGWQKYVVMDFPGARIHFYRLRDLHPIRLDGLRSTTDEQVEVHEIAQVLDAFDYSDSYAVDWLEHRAIPNLAWLIPLAAYTADRYAVVHVQASMALAINAPATPPGGGS